MEGKRLYKSVVFNCVKMHPILFLLALFMLSVGVVSGVSSGGIVYDGMVLTKAALFIENGAAYNIFSGLIHSAASVLLLYSMVSLANIHKAFLPISLIAFLIYGFFCGFSYSAFFLEFKWWGILYRLFFIMPDTMLITALLLCLLKTYNFNSDKSIDVYGKNIKSIEKEREIMLLLLSIGIEGLVIPLTLRLLLY